MVYSAVILNWRFMRLNVWPHCVVITSDIARHGSDSDVWFSKIKINVLPLELYARPSNNHLQKTADLK